MKAANAGTAISYNAEYVKRAARWRQGAAAGCARQCPSGGACGGKVPLPGARSTPFGVARRLVLASLGWFSISFTRRIHRAAIPFTRRTTSAVSAANECEGITCLRQVTKNDSDEAERSERSPPPGVARNAGGEGVDGRSPASKRRSRARERKCPATGPAFATGEGVRGTCATSPGAIRRPEVRYSLPSGQLAGSCAQKSLPSGHPASS